MIPKAAPVPFPALKTALPVRLVALDLLERIVDDAEVLDQAFAHHKDLATLNTLDRALVRMMVATTLRHMGTLDDWILTFTERAELPTPPRLLHILRLSLTQIFFMTTPDHAAVHLAVDLAEAADLPRQKGLVNAVLRRALRERDQAALPPEKQEDNIPSWMWRDWVRHFGIKTAREIAKASLTEAPLDLTLRNPATSSEWVKRLQAVCLPTGTLRLQNHTGAIDALPGFQDGAWWVQDAAAALAVQAFPALQGRTVIDLCAAPGGKTAQLAAAGAHVIAVEKSAARIKPLEQNLARLGLMPSVHLVHADGATWKPEKLVDAVLIDAPCTATGTLRRHPDILVHRTAKDVARMAKVQRTLLQNAARMVQKGGTIVYAVCSLQYAEGEGQVLDLEKHIPELKLDPFTIKDMPGAKPFITREGTIRTLPPQLEKEGGMDGFFIARFKRV